MRYILLAATALAGVVLYQPKADAVIVECSNCSTIYEELISDARQVQQLATQLSSYQTQLRQWANMIQNTIALPQEAFAQVQSDIMMVRNLTNAASLLTGNSGAIINRLQSAQGYANQASFLPQNIGNQFTVWQQTLGNASNSLGRTLGVQQGQEQSYTALQAAINQHSQTAAGQMQAIQAGNELASLTSTQLNQIQTTLTAAAQEQATRDDVLADRERMQEQAELQFSQYQAAPTTGAQGF